MYQISSPGPIPSYATKISHIPTHFYAPTNPTGLCLLKGQCVFGYVMPARACLRGHLPVRVTVTEGHHDNRVRWNNHAERVTFYQRDSWHDTIRANMDTGHYANGAMSLADYIIGGG